MLVNDFALLLDLYGNSEGTKLLIWTVLFCLVYTAPAKCRVELRAKIGLYRNRCFLDLNCDWRLYSLCFNRKGMEKVMEIIWLWPDFSKVAKHGFKEFYWWKGILFTWSYRLYMFSIRKKKHKINLTSCKAFLLKRFTKLVNMSLRESKAKNGTHQ